MPNATEREMLETACGLIELLAGVSHAHLTSEEGRVEKLLSQVTPSACRRVATGLRKMLVVPPDVQDELDRADLSTNVFELRR